MAASIEVEAPERPQGTARIRLLGLGNELLGDDAFGIVVARRAAERFGERLDVVTSSASGFYLLEDILGAEHLIVVDTVLTGNAQPGAVTVFREEELRGAPGGSPHYVGLFDVLSAARQLGLPAPREVVIIGVEPADSLTMGGAMHAAVESAIPVALELVGQLSGLDLRERRPTTLQPAREDNR